MSGQDARDGSGTGKGPESDLSARLRRLDRQLDAKRDEAVVQKAASRRSAADSTALGRALRMSTEFIAGILAGGGLGWLFDRLLGTSPWGLIVLLMLGFAAGILNLLRASKSLDAAAQAKSEPRDH